jgi:DNA modification methylase
VTIWKCPVIEMQRTKNHGLLYKNLRKDSCGSRQGMADYLMVFRKWDDQSRWRPVPHEKSEFPLEQWQDWASPVWMDIQQPRVLNYQIAREDGDEKHICPLQLDVIERPVTLWSNPGEVVFSPFAGIGSELYVALQLGRRVVGVELKRAYWQIAVRNLESVEFSTSQPSLFAGV